MNNKPTKITLLDLQIFFRNNCKSLNLSFAEEAVICRILSRNGINEDFLVNQKMLADDMNLNVSSIRRIVAPLIEKNIIISTKISRSTCYSISEQYRSIISGNKLNTAQIKAVSAATNSDNTAQTQAVYTAQTQAVLAGYTIYTTEIEKEIREGEEIHLRSKIELTRVEKQKSEEIDPRLFYEIKLNNDGGKFPAATSSPIVKTMSSIVDTKGRDIYSGFSEFWGSYPKKTRYEQCLKFWQQNNLEEISDHINQDLKNRINNHAPWLRNFKAGTVQYIPNPYDHLLHERWHEPIIPLTESEKQNYHQARNNNDNKNRPCIKKQQDSFFCRLRERIEQRSESEIESTSEVSIG